MRMGAMTAVIEVAGLLTPTVGVMAVVSRIATIQTVIAVMPRWAGPSLVTFRRAGYAIRGITIPTTAVIAAVAKSTRTAVVEAATNRTAMTARVTGASTRMMS